MAVIELLDGSSWMTGFRAYLLLLDRMESLLSDPVDRARVERALSVEYLFLDKQPRDRGLRFERALAEAIRELHEECSSSSAPFDRTLFEQLIGLESHLFPGRMGSRGYFPDQARERRGDYLGSTPGSRLDDAVRVSRTATKLAAAGAAARR